MRKNSNLLLKLHNESEQQPTIQQMKGRLLNMENEEKIVIYKNKIKFNIVSIVLIILAILMSIFQYAHHPRKRTDNFRSSHLPMNRTG